MVNSLPFLRENGLTSAATHQAPTCNITLQIAQFGLGYSETLRIADISKNQIRELAQKVIDTCVDGALIGGRQSIGGFATNGLRQVADVLSNYQSMRMESYGT